MIQKSEWEKWLSGGNHTNILKDAETIFEEKCQKFFIIVKVKLTVRTCWMIVSFRITNLYNFSQGNLNPFRLVGKKGWVL